jgi:hypothetical protein
MVKVCVCGFDSRSRVWGLIMTVECLEWILDLITSEKAPGPYKAQTSAF